MVPLDGADMEWRGRRYEMLASPPTDESTSLAMISEDEAKSDALIDHWYRSG